MTSQNKNNQIENQKGVTPDRAKKLQLLLDTAIKDFKTVVDSFDNISNAVSRRKTIDAENAVKLTKSKADIQKEVNRHNEAMASIELEYKRIAEATANGELKWSMIHEMVGMIKEEYSKLNNMDDSMFLGEESRISRENLRRTILELSKEIIHS